MKKAVYNPRNHGSFESEWGIHKNNREWWYATGIMFDEEGNMYSWQYTLLHLAFGPIVPKVTMVALTDYKDKRHYYFQDTFIFSDKVSISENEASVKGVASAVKKEKGIEIKLSHKDFSLDVMCDYGKGAVWHCDNGLLQMGIPDENATTLYYSWTSMPTEGTLVLKGKKIKLTGKTWFDKQGGTYNMADMRCHWEWFSLRFFDDEEMMLFTFPHNESPEYDGTYIDKDGKYIRLFDYSIERLTVTEHKGLKWSAGWRFHSKYKDKDYLIEPLQEGHMNFAYFEELCSIKTTDGKMVGYAFAELLPGVLNKDTLMSGSANISMKNLFKRVEF